MGADESSSSSSLDHSDIVNMMMVAEEESLEPSRKRKLPAEESDLLPSSKHFCLEQQQKASLPDSSCPSSDIESTECCYAIMEDTKTGDETSSSSASVCMSKDPCYLTGSSSWSSGYATSSIIDQSCSKGNDKVQEYIEDFEFICPEFAVEELIGSEDSNLEESYSLSSARWSGNADSKEATKNPTIDLEFEEYFSTLMM